LYSFKKNFKLILLLLLIFFNAVVKSQIIRDPLKYPGGEVPPICATDPTDASCIIILPPSLPGVDYHFQIPLDDEAERPNCLFTIIQTTPCASGSPVPNSASGDIDMPAAARCKPLGVNNYLEIEVNLNIISGPNVGQSDIQKYRLPILRDPVKVALVLDISGSMGWVIPGGTDIRWNVLKKAVELFVEKLEISQQSGDQIALTYFTTNLVTPNAPLDAGFIDITPDETLPIEDRSYSIIKSEMDPPRGPLAATAMGL